MHAICKIRKVLTINNGIILREVKYISYFWSYLLVSDILKHLKYKNIQYILDIKEKFLK